MKANPALNPDVASLARSKDAPARSAHTQVSWLALITALLASASATAEPALPQGGAVSAGAATISKPSGSALTISQTSGRAVIDWQSFSIGQGATVTFRQPDSGSATLNRVTGSTPTSIAGQLKANGQIYLVNPNGIAITPSGAVKVGGGFVGSTLAISNSDFESVRLNFNGDGASAAISNAGSIETAPGGFVGLLGGSVSVSGLISAPLGMIAMGSGEQATLDFNGGGFLQVAMPSQGGIDVSGRVKAAGGRVEIKASAAAQAARDVVNIAGAISASSAHRQGGVIVLDGGGGGVTVSGKLSAGSRRAKGGRIDIGGRDIALRGARIDASGGAGGGRVRIGGGAKGAPVPGLTTAGTVAVDAKTRIAADARRSGDGGAVTLWSDELTAFRGAISAQALGQSGNGGEAEVSGGHLNYLGTVDLRSAHGAWGALTLDPGAIVICHAGDAGCSAALNVAGVQGDASTLSTDYLLDTTLAAALSSASVSLTASTQITDSSSAVSVQTAGGGALTLAAPHLTLAGAYGVNGGLVLSNTDAVSTITGLVSGTGGVTKTGTGTLTLSGANSYTGATTVNLGALKAGSATAVTGDLTVASGATFDLGGNSLSLNSLSGAGTVTDSGGAATLTLSGGTFDGVIQDGAGVVSLATATNGGLTLTGVNTYSGSTTIPSVSSLTLSGSGQLGGGDYAGAIAIDGGGSLLINTSANQTFSGAWSGFGAMSKNVSSTSTLTLSGTGAARYLDINAGTLKLGSTTALNSFVQVSVASGATLDLNGNSNSVSSLAGAGVVTNSALSAATFSDNGGTFSGVIQDGAGGISFAAPVNARVNLTGANTFTGDISLAAVSSLTLSGAGTLGGGHYAGAITLDGGPNPSNGFFYSSSSNQTLSGPISGSGRVTTSGVGTGVLSLSGPNSFNGGVTINGGTLNLGSSGALGSSGTIAFGGGTLQYSAANQTDYSDRFSADGAEVWRIDTNGQSVAFATALAGARSSLAKLGAGTLTLSASNSYAGATSVIAGTLAATDANALGLSAVSISGAGAILESSTVVLPNPVTYGSVIGSQVGTVQAGYGAWNSIVTAPGLYFNGAAIAGCAGTGGTCATALTATDDAINALVSVGATSPWTLSGVVSGGNSNSTFELGSGFSTNALTLSGANNYSGATFLQAGATVKAGAAAIFSANSAVTANGALDLNGNSLSLGSLAGAGTVTNSGAAATLTVGSDDSSTTFAGAIQNGTGAVALIKTGNGTFTLSGANAYTGATTVSAGTLQIGDGTTGSLSPSSSVSVSSGATLALNRATTFSGAIANDGTVSFLQSGSLNVSGVISGAGDVTQSGTGQTILSAPQTYTGATTVSAGTLQIGSGSTGSIAGASAVSVSSGATLALFLATGSTFSNDIASDGTVSFLQAGTLNVPGLISGAGEVTQSGSGGTTLSNANSYTGATNVTNGTLQIAGAGSLGAGNYAGAINLANGATLQYSSSAAQTFSGAITGGGANLIKDTAPPRR